MRTRRVRGWKTFRSIVSRSTLLAWALGVLGGASADAQSKLSVHGFLTQAYGQSDGYQVFGIPEDGTWNLRFMALQFRYSLTRNDTLVLQFNHERTGESGLSAAREEVAVDWAFYQRRFSSTSLIKVGRIPVPFGFYNEVRDVGTVLPFFRAPLSIYGDAGETTVISQTVDGLLLSHRFDLSSWSVVAELYGGEWDALTQAGEAVVEAHYTDAVGLQLWLHTPLPSLRFGAAVNRFQGPGLFSTPGVGADFESLLFSAEGGVGRFHLRGEYFEMEADFDYEGYYAQLGFDITEKFRIYLQGENAEFVITLPFLGELTVDYNEEFAVGLNYAFIPEVLLKLEAHFTEGYAVEDVALTPFDPPYETDYGIVSISVSF